LGKRFGAALDGSARHPRSPSRPGGYGDTDAACDAADYSGSSFAEVCTILESVSGPPARTWDELAEGNRGWYLGEPSDHTGVGLPNRVDHHEVE
jgi:hypothetical protein